MERELGGRTALVTGGAKGIGRAICVSLAKAGANVAINYLSSETAARETAKLVEAEGVRALPVRANVADENDVARLVDEVERELGPVDLLVNNAGLFDFLGHDETTLETWRRMLDNNLTSAFLAIWAVKPGMIERGFGRIVNVASIAGLRARPQCIAYAVSKAGMISLTRSTAEALGPHGIRVNAVAPGLVDTDMANEIDEETRQRLIETTPLRRLGVPEDIAEVVLFLLSERSRFVTGQTYVASGGRVTLP